MIVTEQFEIDGKTYIRTYSDSGMMIHGGVPEGDYSEATDPASLNRTYTETDIPIESDGDEYAEAGRILMGVES